MPPRDYTDSGRAFLRALGWESLAYGGGGVLVSWTALWLVRQTGLAKTMIPLEHLIPFLVGAGIVVLVAFHKTRLQLAKDATESDDRYRRERDDVARLKRERRELEARFDDRAVRARVMQHLGDYVRNTNRPCQREVRSDVELAAWKSDFQVWRDGVRADLNLLAPGLGDSWSAIGTLMAADVGGAFNGEHSNLVLQRDHYIDRLQQIIVQQSTT